MAAIVTTVVTVILLGVLIPIFQTTQAKSDEVRDSLEFRVGDLRRRDASRNRRARQTSCEAIPHVASVELITKAEALKELEEDLGKEKSEELLAQLSDNPLPANFQVKADDAANLDAVRDGGDAAGPERQAAADLADRPENLRPPGGHARRSSR